MPRLRRQLAGYRAYSRGHQIQLVSGTDDFGDAWGDPPATIFPQQRAAWPPAPVLADMKTAWERHGDELCEEFETWRPLWAELVFDEGKQPAEAIELHRAAWRAATA